MAKLSIDDVYNLITEERIYQNNKWGSIEQKNQSLPGFLLILRKELEEAEDGWMKNREGRDSCLSEIIQVAAVAVACLQQYWGEDNVM